MADGTNARFDFSAPVPPAAELGRVHFIAIGGAGMSAVARLFLDLGLAVSGSDAKDTATLRALEAAGALVRVGHDAAAVEGVDTVVVSSAIPESNVELAQARARGLRILHRSQALATIGVERVPVAVAGANGKTTTSSMLTVSLLAAGTDPSFALGAELPGPDTNAEIGAGAAFVVEADESDGSFVVYRPHVAVVTNVQPDHLDFYGTFDNVVSAYHRFAQSRRPGGLLLACHDDAGSRALAQWDAAQGRRVLTYGFEEGADIRLTDPLEVDVRPDGYGAQVTVTVPGEEPCRLTLAMPGRHNLLNAAAAYAAARLGFDADRAGIVQGLADFSGARRRFEIRGVVDGVTVIDDYAHNAPKVDALVRTAVALVGRDRVHVVFQPHLFSRTRDFAAGFAAALAQVDDVILLDIYGAREAPIEGVTSDLVADRIRALDDAVRVDQPVDRGLVPALIADRARRGDLVLLVGAGDITEVAPAVLQALEGR